MDALIEQERSKTYEYSDMLLAKIPRVKIIKITPVLAVDHIKGSWKSVTKGDIQECLWARVILELDGKKKTFPLIGLLGSEDKVDDGSMDIFDFTIIRFCGGSRKTYMPGRLAQALNHAGAALREKTYRVIRQASKTRAMRTRVEKHWKKARRIEMKNQMKSFLHQHDMLDILTPRDAMEAFKEAQDLHTVSHVLLT